MGEIGLAAHSFSLQMRVSYYVTEWSTEPL